MKNKTSNKKKLFLGSTMLTMVVIGFITAFLIAPSSLSPLIQQRSWKPVRGADGTPGSTECGVINVYIYPHQANTATYDSALSEVTAYAHFDVGASLNAPLDGNVPYNTAFDIAVTCQFNYTVAYNTTSTAWDKDYVRGLITCADLSIGADTTMSEGDFFNIDAGNHAEITFYMNSGGSGYTISHGQTVNVTSFKMQGYY